MSSVLILLAFLVGGGLFLAGIITAIIVIINSRRRRRTDNAWAHQVDELVKTGDRVVTWSHPFSAQMPDRTVVIGRFEGHGYRYLSETGTSENVRLQFQKVETP